jgi:hypothetical protein
MPAPTAAVLCPGTGASLRTSPLTATCPTPVLRGVARRRDAECLPPRAELDEGLRTSERVAESAIGSGFGRHILCVVLCWCIMRHDIDMWCCVLCGEEVVEMVVRFGGLVVWWWLGASASAGARKKARRVPRARASTWSGKLADMCTYRGSFGQIAEESPQHQIFSSSII